MTNKEKFIEVFGLNLCYCGSPEYKGLFYITDIDEPRDIFLDKFEAKRWLESGYKERVMTDKEKEINTKVRNARLMLHHIMCNADNKCLYDNLVDVDKELYEIRDMLVEVDNAGSDD